MQSTPALVPPFSGHLGKTLGGQKCPTRAIFDPLPLGRMWIGGPLGPLLRCNVKVTLFQAGFIVAERHICLTMGITEYSCVLLRLTWTLSSSWR